MWSREDSRANLSNSFCPSPSPSPEEHITVPLPVDLKQWGNKNDAAAGGADKKDSWGKKDDWNKPRASSGSSAGGWEQDKKWGGKAEEKQEDKWAEKKQDKWGGGGNDWGAASKKDWGEKKEEWGTQVEGGRGHDLLVLDQLQPYEQKFC